MFLLPGRDPAAWKFLSNTVFVLQGSDAGAKKAAERNAQGAMEKMKTNEQVAGMRQEADKIGNQASAMGKASAAAAARTGKTLGSGAANISSSL